jgi:hypothetical protein
MISGPYFVDGRPLYRSVFLPANAALYDYQNFAFAATTMHNIANLGLFSTGVHFTSL